MRLTFLKRQQEVGDIESFFFMSDEIKTWQAGQYINLTMSDVPPVGADRLFSISSASFEKHIRITTVIGPSDFKQRMNTLQPGDIIHVDQLGGDFVWQEEPGHKLFLAGGIGISAFRPIILERAQQNSSLNTTLLYAGKPERRPFLDEIGATEEKDPTFKKVDFIQERLTPAWIVENIDDLNKHLIYIAGSQTFVEGLGDGLMSHGISRAQIKYDWFDNYAGI